MDFMKEEAVLVCKMPLPHVNHIVGPGKVNAKNPLELRPAKIHLNFFVDITKKERLLDPILGSLKVKEAFRYF